MAKDLENMVNNLENMVNDECVSELRFEKEDHFYRM